jgi:hypothetical protein
MVTIAEAEMIEHNLFKISSHESKEKAAGYSIPHIWFTQTDLDILILYFDYPFF